MRTGGNAIIRPTHFFLPVMVYVKKLLGLRPLQAGGETQAQHLAYVHVHCIFSFNTYSALKLHLGMCLSLYSDRWPASPTCHQQPFQSLLQPVYSLIMTLVNL